MFRRYTAITSSIAAPDNAHEVESGGLILLAGFQIIALSALDPDGRDNRDEPSLSYPDALATAESMVAQGKAFRVLATGEHTDEQLQSFLDLGALYDKRD